jgi:uncharacterized protein
VGVQYFVYGRDRPGSFDVKLRLAEEHWLFMDRFADRLIARGPTLTGAGEEALPTGSMHIVELSDTEAARAFAFDEPYHRAGVFQSVQLCRFDNVLGRSIGEFRGAADGHATFLVLALGEAGRPPVVTNDLILYGDLRALDDNAFLGRAALLQAPNAEAAARAVPHCTEVHHSRVGGRPANR